MDFSSRETWAVIHGMVLGVIFLLAFSGALAEMWGLRPGMTTAAGIKDRMKRLYFGFGAMATSAWLTVITGTYIVYPWYRAKLAGAQYAACKGLDLPSKNCSPRDFILSNASGNTAEWHNFGMEWKEHIAWLAPFLATGAFFMVLYYGPRLVSRPWLRNAVIIMLVAAFLAAVVAGALGAFINKVGPIV